MTAPPRPRRGPITIGSLFSGIGGLELGLEMAGLGPVLWQVEKDPFCRSVLARHWPTVPRFNDVTTIRGLPHVDLICGGFPCQDVSSAGKRRGIGGERSGLWWYFASIVRRVRPRFVVVENVASGAKAWLPHVRHQLHMLGYRTRALGVAAADVGAPHLRRRVFVVADAHGERRQAWMGSGPSESKGGQGSKTGAPPHADYGQEHALAVDAEVGSSSETAADANGIGARGSSSQRKERRRPWEGTQPDVVRVVHGLPRGLDGARRRALGNAVVPQCAEVVGHVIAQMVTP